MKKLLAITLGMMGATSLFANDGGLFYVETETLQTNVEETVNENPNIDQPDVYKAEAVDANNASVIAYFLSLNEENKDKKDVEGLKVLFSVKANRTKTFSVAELTIKTKKDSKVTAVVELDFDENDCGSEISEEKALASCTFGSYEDSAEVPATQRVFNALPQALSIENAIAVVKKGLVVFEKSSEANVYNKAISFTCESGFVNFETRKATLFDAPICAFSYIRQSDESLDPEMLFGDLAKWTVPEVESPSK